MAYEELVLSSSIPKIVEEFIREGVEPHLHDINAMLRLPLPEAGCNFAIAQVLLNIVSGISTTLYRQKGAFRKIIQGTSRYKVSANRSASWHGSRLRIDGPI